MIQMWRMFHLVLVQTFKFQALTFIISSRLSPHTGLRSFNASMLHRKLFKAAKFKCPCYPKCCYNASGLTQHYNSLHAAADELRAASRLSPTPGQPSGSTNDHAGANDPDAYEDLHAAFDRMGDLNENLKDPEKSTSGFTMRMHEYLNGALSFFLYFPRP